MTWSRFRLPSSKRISGAALLIPDKAIARRGSIPIWSVSRSRQTGNNPDLMAGRMVVACHLGPTGCVPGCSRLDSDARRLTGPGRAGRRPDDFVTIWKPASPSLPANLTRQRYRLLPHVTLVIRIAPGWPPALWMTVCDLWGEGQHPCGYLWKTRGSSKMAGPGSLQRLRIARAAAAQSFSAVLSRVWMDRSLRNQVMSGAFIPLSVGSGGCVIAWPGPAAPGTPSGPAAVLVCDYLGGSCPV